MTTVFTDDFHTGWTKKSGISKYKYGFAIVQAIITIKNSFGKLMKCTV